MKTRLGIEKGEIRNIVASTGDYKTTYCLSLIKKFVEAGHNVMYYSIENNVNSIQKRLLDSDIKLGKAKPIFRTLPSLNLTNLRKQVELDINMIKDVRLVIIEDINSFAGDYINMKLFLEDITVTLRENDIACVFTSHTESKNYNNHITVHDIKHSSGAMVACDTVYGIKSIVNRMKLSIRQWITNLFRSKKNKVKPNIEKSIYLSVLKNRFNHDNKTYKLDVNEQKLEFNFKQEIK
jgi:hypothetical protein